MNDPKRLVLAAERGEAAGSSSGAMLTRSKEVMKMREDKTEASSRKKVWFGSNRWKA
jgi:hypothetical protein